MKKIISVFVGFCAALSISNANAEISIKHARSTIASGGSEKEIMIFHMDIFESGLAWANAYIESVGQKKMYCTPPKLALKGENVWQLTDSYIEKNDWVDLEWPIEGMVRMALADAFPCD